jgi:DNA segregation ATPase FtsK/SpoIIIE, S-DNA-T family
MSKKKTSSKKLKRHELILISLSISFVAIVGLLRLGVLGEELDKVMFVFFDERKDIIYLSVLLYASYTIFVKHFYTLKFRHHLVFWLSIWLVLTGTAYMSYSPQQIGLGLISDWFNRIRLIYQGNLSAQGGFFGMLMYALLSYGIARAGTLMVLVLVGLFVLGLLIDLTLLKNLFVKFQQRQEDLDDLDDLPAHQSSSSLFLSPDEPKKKRSTSTPIKTQSAATIQKIGDYTLPSLALLDDTVTKSKSNANIQAAQVKSKRLLEILGQFGVNASLVATHIGPAVTKFEVKPDSNVKITRIASIQDNIKMELAAKELRIEAPIPGRNAVGIEIPNVEMIPVRMLEMMRDIDQDKYEKKLLFPLGKDLMGKAVFSEMDKMPHLLIAGATGSGKSVCVNSIIINYLLRTSPDELKLLLIDPKKVEFTPYHRLPHLISPVVSDATEAAKALRVIVSMMENRYEIFSNYGVRNIASYHELFERSNNEALSPMPWIVVIIDELADLMMVAGKDVEGSIQRITQLARAAGIHLIVATQRPSTDVITGIIKANIPSRIAFAVSSGIDSRTIIDGVGAERLLGYGDMLFFPVGEPAPIRVQGVYVTDDEIRRITETVSLQRKPSFDEAFLNLKDNENGVSGHQGMDDPLYEEVKNYIIETQRASTSSIQRRFGLGYNRAARIIDVLEEQGIVGPSQGSKARDVYVRK